MRAFAFLIPALFACATPALAQGLGSLPLLSDLEDQIAAPPVIPPDAVPLNSRQWDLIEAIEIDEKIKGDSYVVTKSYPDDLIAMARSGSFEVEGYFVPVMAQGSVRQFLMVRDPAECPFCGSSGYGLALEVITKRPVPDMGEFERITVRGTLELVDDPETWQAVILKNATLTRSGS